MCIIIATSDIEKNKEIVKGLIKANWEANPDGAGIVIPVGDKKWAFRKGLNLPSLIEIINRINGNIPAIVHLRKKSVGKVGELQTHPFPLHKEALGEKRGVVSKLLFHNGTATSNPIYEGFSDTELLADVIIEAQANEKTALKYLELQSKKTKSRFLLVWENKMHFIGEWFKVGEEVFLSKDKFKVPKKKRSIMLVKGTVGHKKEKLKDKLKIE